MAGTRILTAPFGRRGGIHAEVRRALRFLVFFYCGVLAGSASARAEDWFVDVARERGIEYRNVNGATGRKYLVETMVPGAAWIDYDRDGWYDLYLIQGHGHPETALTRPGDESAPGNVLLRNVAGEKFVDVTTIAGVGDRGYGMGAAVGDYDGNGYADLYVTNYGRNTLYRNTGNGRFEEVTKEAGVAAPNWSSSATWADFDGDGRLDLFVVSYLRYDSRKDAACLSAVPGSQERQAAYCHPHRFAGDSDVLFHNQGDGTFRDVTRRAGLAGGGWLESKGLGVVASDFDRDGDPDILVANDSVPNALWRNLGGLRFENVALEVGFALNAQGAPQAGMGLDRGDVNGDGFLDYYVTNFSRETDALYRNANGYFVDSTVACQLAGATYLPLSFGTKLLDFDLDGDLDLYVATGHILDNAEKLHPGEDIRYRQPDLLFKNSGEGVFDDVSAEAGAWFRRAGVERALAVADYDNDGDEDLLLTHVAGPVSLLENRAGDRKRWVGVELRAPPLKGVSHGAWVELLSGGRRQVREVQTDGSYLAAHDPRVRFGLDAGSREASIRVRWPGRSEFKSHEKLAAGRYHVLRPDGR